MATLYINFFQEPHTHGKNTYGAHLDGKAKEDATTSTGVENHAIPENASLISFYSPDADHFIRLGSTDVVAESRIRIPQGQFIPFEIPQGFRGGLVGYRSVA